MIQSTKTRWFIVAAALTVVAAGATVVWPQVELVAKRRALRKMFPDHLDGALEDLEVLMDDPVYTVVSYKDLLGLAGTERVVMVIMDRAHMVEIRRAEEEGGSVSYQVHIYKTLEPVRGEEPCVVTVGDQPGKRFPSYLTLTPQAGPDAGRVSFLGDYDLDGVWEVPARGASTQPATRPAEE